MDDIYKAVIKTKTHYLVHYNHNHDKLGRFSKSNGTVNTAKQTYKQAQKIYKKENDEAWQYRKTDNNLFRKKMAKAQEKLAKAYLKFKESQDKKARDYADYVSGKDGDESIEDSIKRLHDIQESAYEKLSDSEKKNVIKVTDKHTLSKNDINIKSAKDVVGVSNGLDVKKGIIDISLSMKSPIKTYKEEIRSKDGVHIIRSNPTYIEFENVEHSSGAGIDRNKVKQLDDFARSKESNKIIYSGRDYVAKHDNKPATNYSPFSINYRVDSNGNPTISSVIYMPKDHETKGSGIVFFEDGKPVLYD